MKVISPLKKFRKHPAFTDPKQSNLKGISGFLEGTMRRFKIAVSVLLLVPLYAVGSFCLGLAAVPGMFLIQWGYKQIEFFPWYTKPVIMGFLVSSSYILFGFCLIFVIPATNLILGMWPKPWRGPYYSLHTVRWAVHNALTYIPRYVFLEYITPTPFNNLFYKLMGMKIGRDVQINTTNISDPSLIEMGDKVTIGGSATIVAHYGQGGYLVIAPVKISKGATVGLRATVMGDVEIGENAKVLANSVVLPKSRIPAGETWGGVPAQKIEIGLKTHRRLRKKAA